MMLPNRFNINLYSFAKEPVVTQLSKFDAMATFRSLSILLLTEVSEEGPRMG